MERRQVLRLVGLGVLGFGGCLGNRPTGESTTSTTATISQSPATRTSETTTTHRGTETATDTPSEAATSTTEPTDTATQTETPPDVRGQCQSPVSIPSDPIQTPDATSVSGPCPPSEGDTPTVCMAETPSDAPLVITTDWESTTLPEVSGTITLRNQSDRGFRSNFYGWELSKYNDDAWHYVAPGMHLEPLDFLEAGDSHIWNVSVDSSERRSPDPTQPSGDDEITGTGLGGGHYAFSIDGWFGEYTEDTQERRYVTRVRVQGDPLSLWPTTALESVECEDWTVVASRDNPLGSRAATYTLERLGTDPEREQDHVIAEQLFFEPRLRDMIILSRTHGADRVRLHGQSSYRPARPDDPRLVRYDGDVYCYEGELDDQSWTSD